MVFLLWCVCGGFLLHFFGANYLSILVKPNYEKPIDTAEDILDRGLTIIFFPGTESIVESMKNSPSNISRELAERTIVPKEYNEYKTWVKDIALGVGSAVVEKALLWEWYEIKFAKEKGKKWYRSKDRKGGMNPFTSYMLNKKWTLEEEFNNLMLRFQQVTMQ